METLGNSRNTNDPTNGRTDGQTDEADLISDIKPDGVINKYHKGLVIRWDAAN